MFKRPLLIFCALALGMALAVFALQSSLGSRMKMVIGSAFLPLFGLSSTLDAGAEKAAEKIVPKSVLQKELNDLRLENEQLRILGLQAETLFQENNRLRTRLEWQKNIPWKRRLARVIGRDPSNWWKMIHIDLGSRDGLTNNLPVITSDGLVGRLGEVGLSRSQVILIGDPNCHVSVLLEDSREQGAIAPDRINLRDPSIVEMGYLSRNSILKPDQKVVTSGMGSVFPAGIPVGRVLDFQTMSHGLFTEARIKLAVSTSSLEEVWVLLP